MIGNNIRGIRHLARISGTSLRDALIFFKEGIGYQFCKVYKTENDQRYGRSLFIFNNAVNYGGESIGHVISSGMFSNDDIRMLSTLYSRIIILSGKELIRDFPYINSIILLPETFEKDYSEFLSNNAKMIRNLTSKYGYSTNDDISKIIYMYSSGSKNFYLWAINNYYQNYTSLTTIKRILFWSETYGQLAKKLSKNTITAYTSSNDIIDLYGETIALRKEKRINDVINSFNTVQKRLLRDAELSEKDKTTIAKFYRLSEAKKLNFIKKVSTIEDFDELIRQLRHVTSTHFEWNKESFIDFIGNVENMEYEIILNEGDIVLLRVSDYETIKHLAKTTNWCISKNKTYWNQYVEQAHDATQYMLFDFSKKEDDLLSIIGFTTKYNRGITNAHDFANNDMMRQNVSDERVLLNTFIASYKSNDGIYNVLKDCGIDITLVAHYDKPLYEWTKESMYKYLLECVKKDNIDILSDNGNLVAISVVDKNIRYFLGDTYIDTVSSDNWGLQHIIFMDFSMNQYDPNRILYAIISPTGCGNDEAYCIGMFNERTQNLNFDFNTKLCQYGLPYDIIRRPNDPYDKIRNAFFSYNTPMLNEVIPDNDTLLHTIYDYIGEESVANTITSTITENMSFDYLDLFYTRGLKLHDSIGCGHTSNIIRNVFGKLIETGRQRGGGNDINFRKPTNEEIEAFYNKSIPNRNKVMYIGSYLAILKIIDNEGKDEYSNTIFKKLTQTVLMFNKSKEVFDDIMEHVAQVLDFNNLNDTCLLWIDYAYKFGGERLKSILSEITGSFKKVKKVMEDKERHTRRLEEPAFAEVTRL